APPATLPSHHSAPSVLPNAASSIPPPPEPASTQGVVPPATSAPRAGASPGPRALVPFHAESTLWPYPRAPLDDREEIVELDFADTSALSDADAFERRRQNGRNGAKMSKKDKAREREEIERSWDVPGKSATPSIDNAGLLHVGAAKPLTVSPGP